MKTSWTGSGFKSTCKTYGASCHAYTAKIKIIASAFTRLKSVHAPTQSFQSLSFLPEETFDHWLAIADFTGLPYFSRFLSGLKSHALIMHDYLSQSKFVKLPRGRTAMRSRPASKYQKKFCFVSKQACMYCIRSED